MKYTVCKIVAASLMLCQIAVADTSGPWRAGAGATTAQSLQVTALTVVAAASRAKPKPIDATFAPYSRTQGWDSPAEAAFAFYRAHNSTYLATTRDTELAGFLLTSDTGQFFFTTAVSVPTSFTLRARVSSPSGWQVKEFLHTHPGGNRDQDHFSEYDRLAVLRGTTDYFLRGPDGNVRFMNTRLARSSRTLSGARGKLVCPNAMPCLEKHPRHDERTAGDWGVAIRRPAR